MSELLRKKPIKQRLYFIDFVKAVSILAMIYIHILENFQTESVQTSSLSYVISIMNALVGASAFMICMGITMNYSRNNTPKIMLKRGFILLGAGYALNICRSITVFFLAPRDRIWYEILNIDIFHFAGLAMIVMGIMFYFKVKPYIIPVIALVMNITIYFIGDALPFFEPIEGDYLSGLGMNLIGSITGLFYCSSDSLSCFPLLVWFIYPAIGYCFGYYFTRCNDRDRLMKRLMMCSFIVGAGLLITDVKWNTIPMLVSFSEFKTMRFVATTDLAYNVSPIEVTFTMSVVFFALGLLYFAFHRLHNSEPAVASKNPIVKVTSFMGKNLTVIYVIQWLVINNLIFILDELSAIEVYLCYFRILAVTILLTIGYKKAKKIEISLHKYRVLEKI